ncbi:restriction system-associated AAA family ATPase [Flavobacterium sp.]|uniref:restriction system-associated AAA family ATPase n=1 Tax=Flavobacterium sp. TaxID=239 RepID=UPI00261B4FFD|nr:restriction system-associated AAA family ATPase [Flavobacterium sp.]
MKIQYLKLLNKYRSLEPFEYQFLKHPLLLDKIDPICLVGLNGSGKSNFLELLSDIFYEIEVYFLYTHKLYLNNSPKYFPYSDNKSKTSILFHIEYEITVKQKRETIRIIRTRERDEIKFYRKSIKKNSLQKDDFVKVNALNARDYIPLTVAYTSGLNDLLTLPYVDLQDYYAEQVANEAISSVNPAQKILSPNLLLLNYDSNAAIVVSNFILAETNKQEIFTNNLRVSGMNTFRIVIRLHKLYGNKKVQITQELNTYIEQLKDCATLANISIDDVKGNEYVFDFLVNKITINLFKDKFGNVQNLFEALTKLNLLNTLCIQKKYKDLLRKKREKGQLIKFPQIASLDKIFSIENIELVLKHPEVRTEYEKISDGEHQFIHILGGILLFDTKKADRDILYLLDEPDTHFNPLWRSDFFYQMDKVLANKNVEFVVTTHSPFILSDCHGYNVFKFKRTEGKVTFSRVEKETYGATYENVTESLFDPNDDDYKHFDSRIAKLAFLDIEKLHSEIAEIDSHQQWIEKRENFLSRIRMLGESVDRLYLLDEFSKCDQKFKEEV